METENTFNDVQEPVVEVQEADTSEVAETEEPTIETKEEPVKAEPVAKAQGQDENAKYAAARREAEAEKKRIESQQKRLMDALKVYGYEGSPDEIADNLLASQQGITPEEAKAKREAEEQAEAEKSKVQGELEFYKELAVKKLMDDDLHSLQEVYPEVKSLSELGDDFMNLLTATRDPILAYEASKAKAAMTMKPVPPEMGSVSSVTNKDKDFYTSAEVDKLTEHDYEKNPKLMDIVRKSMLKW